MTIKELIEKLKEIPEDYVVDIPIKDCGDIVFFEPVLEITVLEAYKVIRLNSHCSVE